MTDEAVRQEGNEDGQESRPQGVAPGRQNMGAILAKRAEMLGDETKRTQEMLQGAAGTVEAAPPAEGEPAPVATDATPAADAPPAEGAPATDAPQQKHKFKVNGREIELTTEDLIAKAQLGIGAHEVFAEAKKLRGETAAERAEIERIAKLVNPNAIKPNTDAAPAEPASDASDPLANIDVAKIGNAISFGTDEERAAAIRELATHLKGTGKPETVDPQKLKEDVAQDVVSRIRETTERQNALTTFASEFPEIVDETNPASRLLTYGAAEYARQLMDHNHQTGVEMPLVEVYRKAGAYIRAQVKGLTESVVQESVAKANTTAATTTLAAKEERKAGAPQPPAPAPSVRAEATPEKKPMSSKEYVASLQRNRPGSTQRPAA